MTDGLATASAEEPDSLSEAELSPLWMITDEPSLHELVRRLQRFREAYEAEAHPGPLVFSRRHITDARQAFGSMIRRGEERLHQLCSLLAGALLGKYQMQSVVIGEALGERFTLMLDLSDEQVYATTDLDLGNRQLDRLRFLGPEGQVRPALVSNVVEYQALEPNRFNIYKLLSRVKAEEEIWNKVADEIFNLDGLVLRDKQLRHLSRFVKDVFGVKIVVGQNDDVYKVQKTLALLELDEAARAKVGLLPGSAGERLDFVEVKDYLQRTSRKRSGWEAMKSVVRWADRTFEIQIQPLSNFLHERELLTKESHAGFKTRREQLREQIARQLPLFGYYLALLRWLFSGTLGPPPALEGVEVRLED